MDALQVRERINYTQSSSVKKVFKYIIHYTSPCIKHTNLHFYIHRIVLHKITNRVKTLPILLKFYVK